MFTLLQMAYYDMQPEMDVTADAAVSYFVEVLMPTGWHGYIAVAVVLFLHFVCVIVTVILFVTQTQFTLLGNTWSAVGQITVGGTEGALVAATAVMETDKQVRRRIGKDGGIVVLSEPT